MIRINFKLYRDHFDHDLSTQSNQALGYYHDYNYIKLYNYIKRGSTLILHWLPMIRA